MIWQRATGCFSPHAQHCLFIYTLQDRNFVRITVNYALILVNKVGQHISGHENGQHFLVSDYLHELINLLPTQNVGRCQRGTMETANRSGVHSGTCTQSHTEADTQNYTCTFTSFSFFSFMCFVMEIVYTRAWNLTTGIFTHRPSSDVFPPLSRICYFYTMYTRKYDMFIFQQKVCFPKFDLTWTCRQHRQITYF